MSAVIGPTQIIHKDDFAYISHPSIARLDDDEWVVAFLHSRRRDPNQHPPGDPLFRTLISRSADQGQTWDPPHFAPDFDCWGSEVPGIAKISTGDVVLTQFRFGWYPLGLARRRRAAGEPISIHLRNRGWTEDFSDEDWSLSTCTWARGYHGLYAHLSSDGGRYFGHSVKIDCGSYRDGFTRVGVSELSDGQLAYAVCEHHPPTSQTTFLVTSSTQGRSWNPPTPICSVPDGNYGEPHVVEVAPGELLCMLRESRFHHYLFSTRSSDGGATWSDPVQTPMLGCPGHVLLLRDGRLLCSYGRRREPFSIRACLSEDGGSSWLIDREIVVRDDLPNGNLGYPTTMEYAPGKLFSTYYGETPDRITCVQGTFFDID